MKFKEIKPGMVIHCGTETDARNLLWHLDELGYTWRFGDKLTRNINYEKYLDETCYTIYDGYIAYGSKYGERDEITEFSDLIEPEANLANKANDLANPKTEMSAEEVLEWLAKYRGKMESKECFGRMYDTDLLLNQFAAQEIIQKITAYEAAKKAPEENQKVTTKLMTACEKIEWLNEHSNPDLLMEIFGSRYVDAILDKFTTAEFIERIDKYEAKKAPKPVEVEWVDICRIIQIQDNGFKKCVYEEDVSNTPTERDLIGICEDILKKYISEHDGKYFATVAYNRRVKEDK